MARVAVGLSGGVDSAVAAYLLKEQGFEVVGVFMRNWDSELNNDILGNKSLGDLCPQERDFEDAKGVATLLEIPLKRVNFVKEYWEEVFTKFLQDYKSGITPNPDILCNKKIKFGHFLDYCLQELGVDFVATGHYARVEEGFLLKGRDPSKDQSYFLSSLSREQLKNVIFPLGDWTKIKVREVAKKIGFAISQKPDSTGICFIGKRDFNKFLSNYIDEREGEILHWATKKVLGKHQGISAFTIGQRKGIKVGGLRSAAFVAKKDLSTNQLFVVYKDELELLTSYRLRAKNLNVFTYEFDQNNLSAKFRHQSEESKVRIQISVERDEMEVFYEEGSILPVAGQQVAVYQNDLCIVSGTIYRVYNQVNAKE